MNLEAQRIAIAEACGWTSVRKQPWDVYPVGLPNTTSEWTAIPDYLNDLNVMHDAEKILTNEQWLVYVILLQRRTDYANGGACAWVSAEAWQRAEAFLRTIGKWEDEQ